tara:strand:+ start:395 stop:640 length:246 start_codon:yes stop_codon:yes gene_type:complete
MIIKYFAWLKNITEIEEELISDTNIKDINSLKIFLKKKYPKLEKHFEDNVVQFAINFSYTYENDKINQDDEIALFPPVSGG